MNQKCSAGIGTFLRTMGRQLELSLDELSKVDVSDDSIAVQDGCIVFAEMTALSMLNHGRPVLEVGSAVTKAAAVRASTVLNDIITRNDSQAFYCGGMKKNHAFMEALLHRYGMKYSIAKMPEYICAVGAALIAAE